MQNTRFVCQVRAEKKNEAEILIYDEIGKNWFGEGVGSKELVNELAGLKGKSLRVRINSGGGDVFEGLAIFNALRSHDGPVTTEIDSLAASAASIIALAGDTVRMADNAFFMIHNPHGLGIGGADEMRELAALLDKVGGSLVGIYAEHSGQDERTIRDWMDAETWFTAEEAKEAGFVSQITKGKKVAACADLTAFRNAPDNLRAHVDRFLAAIEDGRRSVDATEDTDTDSTAAGGAAPIHTTAPNQPAPAAQGDPMSAMDTAAHEKTGADAERKRSAGIRALVKEYRELAAIDQSTVDGWLDDSSVTEESVRAQILAQVKAKAKASPDVKVVGPRADRDPKRGFENHIEFFTSVIDNAGYRSREDVQDERLRPLALLDENDKQARTEGLAFLMPRAFNTKAIRAAAGSDEQGGYAEQYGGYLVPESTLPGMLSVPFEGDPTAGRTQSVPMATPTVKIPARTDKNHSTSVSGGFTVTRRPETIDFTSSRMTVEQILLQASSLVGLAFATEEILQDSAISFAALIDAGFRDQFMSHVLNEKIRGNGPGEYEGVLTSACKVEISKESGQAADTINYDNILKMRARCWGYGNAIWLANHDTLPQLAKMSLAVGTGGAPVFIPGTFGATPDTLLGRPVFFSEYPSTVGDAGDIILWNPTQYLEGVYQPLRSAESVHVRFVAHERAFKLWLRNAGACWWRSALTPAKGSNTLSPIVTLAARA